MRMSIYKKVITNLYHLEVLGFIFRTLSFNLKSALIGSESILDLGCGPSSPLQHCAAVKYSCGVDSYEPYISKSRSKKIHDKYICKKIQDVTFPPKFFDAVILIEVFEHMNEADALAVLEKCKVWARKKIVLTTPNGYIGQKMLDGNAYQKHLSGWNVAKLRSLGFEIHGLAGLKCLRTETSSTTMGDDLTVSIKYKPKIFWFFVAAFSQIFVYYFPKHAFELFCVMDLEKNNS